MKRSPMSRHVRWAMGLTFCCLSTQVVAQQSVYGKGADQHWRLRSESKRSNEPVRSRGEKYRLVTAGGQLAWDHDVFEGLEIRPVADGYEDLMIHTKSSDSLVMLNQVVALYNAPQGSYIVHKKGPAFSLGFAEWDPRQEPSPPVPAGVYQWVFRSPPDASSRDHRVRGVVTLETLGLYNTSARNYLVYDRNKRTLRWREP